MSEATVTRYEVNRTNPAAAIVRLPADLVELYVGTDQSGPGGVGFAAISQEAGCAVQLWFEGSDEDAAWRIAGVAHALIDWLQEKRPDHECHEMLEGMLGLPAPRRKLTLRFLSPRRLPDAPD